MTTAQCAWCGKSVTWGVEPYAWVDVDGYVRCADARHMHQGTDATDGSE